MSMKRTCQKTLSSQALIQSLQAQVKVTELFLLKVFLLNMKLSQSTKYWRESWAFNVENPLPINYLAFFKNVTQSL